MRQLVPIILLSLFFSCTGCETDLTTGVSIPDQAEEDEVTTSTGFDELSLRTLELVNRTRRAGCKCGSRNMPPVSPVSLNAKLTAAARSHSADQANMRKMQHLGSDGSKVGTRVTRAGYTWRTVAENVAWNYPDVDAVFAGWLSSPGHCRNIMGADYTVMGMAEEDLYWTQVFAR
ncbi:CAP domain-containing protein [Neolewinella persica]|uniref:CAP domain-containing protein n=1 Tax=Neolewinella persica TaxID=70998 RepID=UPI00039C10AF|nr:CAP domain-containing protein [Neolewinella persica]